MTTQLPAILFASILTGLMMSCALVAWIVAYSRWRFLLSDSEAAVAVAGLVTAALCFGRALYDLIKHAL